MSALTAKLTLSQLHNLLHNSYSGITGIREVMSSCLVSLADNLNLISNTDQQICFKGSMLHHHSYFEYVLAVG